MFGAFLSSLDRGIYVNGDFVPIEVEGADWVDKDDSILKAQVAVQIKIRFDGGVYRDTDLSLIHISFPSATSSKNLIAAL